MNLDTFPRTVAPLFVAASLIAACGASPSSEVSAPPPATPTQTPDPAKGAQCAAIVAKGATRMSEVIEANRSCSTDADCVTVGAASRCFDFCARFAAHAGEAAIARVRDDVDAHECAELAAAGCAMPIPPPCVAPRRPACRAGECSGTP